MKQYPLLVLVITLGWITVSATTAPVVTIFANNNQPQVAFAVAEIQSALAARGQHSASNSLDHLRLDSKGPRIVVGTVRDRQIMKSMQAQGIGALDDLKPEGFDIRVDTSKGDRTYWVFGADDAGAMYGGLEVAEIINCKGLDGIEPTRQNPYMALRGIKFNCPLDERTPTYSNHNGDSQQQNVLVMWDMDFWKQYIDDLARYRYNYLSLWNLHPFPSMVRVPGYEKVALDDVVSIDGTLKMSMEEKIDFWRKVMSYARQRNVDVYLVTWNIFITGEEGIYSKEGLYGLTNKFDNPVTTDYFRKSVKQLILTYPDLAGIGLTTGERMPNLTTKQKEKWAFETYGLGVLDAAEEQPGRKIRLIHRQHQTGAQEIAQTFQPLLDHPDIDFIFSFKYAKAHVMSSTTQPFCNDFVDDIGDLKTIWTMRNDSNYYFRWGAPDFVREFIRNVPYEVSLGFYYGADGYIWGREILSRDPASPRQLEIAKHWFHWMLWGRLGYDPGLSDERITSILGVRFPQVPAGDLFTAWQEASMVYPVTTGFHWGSLDFQWYIEGCVSRPSYAETQSGFHDVNRFITLGTHPGTDNQSIPMYVEAVTSGKVPAGTTPLQVSQQLHQHADKALEILEGFPNATDKELQRTLSDIRSMALLGKYYAHKIRGSTEVALFRKTNKPEHKQAAVKELMQGSDFWDQYVDSALEQYITPVQLNRVGLVDWHVLTSEVRKDLEIARNL